MAVSQDTLRCWQAKLDEQQRLYVEGSSRFRGWRRMSIRLLRFLIATFGDTVAASNPSADSPVPKPQEFTIAPGNNEGDLGDLRIGSVPLPSAGKIQSAIKSIMRANDRDNPPGPFISGFAGSEWIILESFPCDRSGLSTRQQDLGRMLDVSHIESRVMRCDKRLCVEVRYWDLDAARGLLSKIPLEQWHEEERSFEPPVSTKSTQSYASDYSMVGLIVGVYIGLFVAHFLLTTNLNAPLNIGIYSLVTMIVAACTASIGFYVGRVIGLTREHRIKDLPETRPMSQETNIES